MVICYTDKSSFKLVCVFCLISLMIELISSLKFALSIFFISTSWLTFKDIERFFISFSIALKYSSALTNLSASRPFLSLDSSFICFSSASLFRFASSVSFLYLLFSFVQVVCVYRQKHQVLVCFYLLYFS